MIFCAIEIAIFVSRFSHIVGWRRFNDSEYYVTVSHEKIGHIKCLCCVFHRRPKRVFITTFATRFKALLVDKRKKIFVRDIC